MKTSGISYIRRAEKEDPAMGEALGDRGAVCSKWEKPSSAVEQR